MSLFSQLHMGLGGLRAHQYGLEVTGDNIANVSTPGFSRRRLNLSHASTLERYPVGQLGGGVSAGPVTAIRSRFLEARHLLETSVAAGDEARQELLSGVEGIFVEEGGFGFQDELAGLLNAFADLSTQPESSTYREQVLSRAQSLIDRMQGGYERLDDVSREIDQRIVSLTSQANDKLARIADLNERIAGIEGKVDANAERDERAQVLGELSKILEVASYENADGTVTVTLRDGRALVVGDHYETLQASGSGPSGETRLLLKGSDVTSLIGTGEIAGHLDVRDQSIPAYRLALDTLAYELGQQVNALHSAGYALDGITTGNDFFVVFTPAVPGDPTGATMALAVESALVSDPSLVAAAAAAGSPGDGDQALAVSDLSRAFTMNGGTATFSDFYADFLFGLGSDVERAGADARASAAVAAHVENEKLAVSAVSLDEEAVALVQYQRGYEASARFIRAVDEMTQIVMTIGA